MANSVARPHVPEEELHAYCDGELSPAQRVEIAEHLLSCAICQSQRAMVEAIRLRTTTLLAIAVPAHIRGHEIPGHHTVAPSRRRWLGYATGVAAALVGAIVWSQFSTPGTRPPGSQLANTLGVPQLFGLATPAGDTAAANRDRQTEMAVRTTSVPEVKSPAELGRLASAPPVAVPVEVDPVFTGDWAPAKFDDAIKVGQGTLARVGGVAVANVRIHPSAIGGRPTFMVRQQLQDGRPVWVFEGLEADIAPINQVLLASGITMSMVTRTKPDYVGVGADLRVTTRMVTVVGYLTVDSLNVLVSRLTLR